MHRIAITGPESTGKSTLAATLAKEYQTLWVPEYARFYLEGLDRPYQEDDLLIMAQGQIAQENAKAQEASKWLFCDTELTVFKVWSQHAYQRVHPEILTLWEQHQSAYTHYFLTDIDMPWEEDPQREHPHLRQFFMDWYRRELDQMNVPYTVLSGAPSQRLALAKGVLESLET